MDYGVPAAWRGDRRGFWTKRKKTALSLVAVLGLFAGVAVAFKLFDQLVPNNVIRDASSFSFEVWKREAPLDDGFVETGPSTPVFASTSSGTSSSLVSMLPGDTRSVDVRIDNANEPEIDASFQVYADALAVRDENGNAPTNQALVNQFLNLWTFKVQKQKVLSAGGEDVANEDDHGATAGQPNGPGQSDRDDDVRPAASYTTACEELLRSVQRNAPCLLGIVRALGERDAVGGRTDQRFYVFSLSERDEGDQSQFKGWSVTFNLVFQARIPPQPETTSAVER